MQDSVSDSSVYYNIELMISYFFILTIFPSYTIFLSDLIWSWNTSSLLVKGLRWHPMTSSVYGHHSVMILWSYGRKNNIKLSSRGMLTANPSNITFMKIENHCHLNYLKNNLVWWHFCRINCFCYTICKRKLWGWYSLVTIQYFSYLSVFWTTSRKPASRIY